MKLLLNVSDIEITQSQSHVNKMLWTGVLTRVGVPSDGVPYGSNGKLLVIDPTAASKALPTIINMPLNCEYGSDFWGAAPEEVMTGHNLRFIIGSITEGRIEGDALVCSGIIWKQNFPDVAYLINNAVDALGFSIELNVNDYTEDEQYLTVTDLVFTGACTLWKKCAAFESTEFRQLIANKFKQVKDDVNMPTKEELQAMLDAMFSKFEERLNSVQASVEEKVNTMVSEVKAEVDKANTEIQTLAASLTETKEEIKASIVEPMIVTSSAESEDIPTPSVVQTIVANSDLKPNDDKQAKIKEVNASSMSPMEKLKAITKLRFSEQ